MKIALDVLTENLSCGEPIGKIIAQELDKQISEDIIAVLKKYFPGTTIDEKRVLKLARLLIDDEECCTKVSPHEICETGQEFLSKKKE